MIKDFEPRIYQQTILDTCTKKNTLVVLPTGLGKTNIFLMAAAYRMKLYPNSKILLIGPTRPLVMQYMDVFKRNFEIEHEKMAVFTGQVSPEKRSELWSKAKIFFSTPQGLENDIISGRIKLEDISLLGIDEAHRAVGNYAYVFVAKQYMKKASYPRIVGMTASPGSDLEVIKEVCKNLFIEDIEVRTDDDMDVKQYVHDLQIDTIKFTLPKPFKTIQEHLKRFLSERFQSLKRIGILRRQDIMYVNKTDLLKMQAQLRIQISSNERNPAVWQGISILAQIMKMNHALELLETQGVVALHKYFLKLKGESITTNVKAVQNIVNDYDFKAAFVHAEKLYNEGVEHPKLVELQKIIAKEIKEDKEMKIIVFNQYRDNAVNIRDRLNCIDGVRAEIFVGQTKKADTGLTQKQQKDLLDKFSMGDFNVLVATSIGEEGLDVPSVNLVVLYEPVPSAIRAIQRRGRTARHQSGRTIMLMTEGTIDEAYKWASHHKEKKMYTNLKSLKHNLPWMAENRENIKIEKPAEDEGINVFADHREKGSGVLKELIDIGVNIKLEKLENADYLTSSRCAIELKNKEDFVNSIIDGRLLTQAKELKKNFERPLIVLQGDEDIYSIRNVHPNAIRGMLATLAVSYGIPIIATKDEKETAALIRIIAKREQEEHGKDFTLHNEKRLWNLKDMQEYVISALPGVGATLSKPLLRHFKTVKNVINAEEAMLQNVEKIGPKKAKMIKDVSEKEYLE